MLLRRRILSRQKLVVWGVFLAGSVIMGNLRFLSSSTSEVPLQPSLLLDRAPWVAKNAGPAAATQSSALPGVSTKVPSRMSGPPVLEQTSSQEGQAPEGWVFFRPEAPRTRPDFSGAIPVAARAALPGGAVGPLVMFPALDKDWLRSCLAEQRVLLLGDSTQRRLISTLPIVLPGTQVKLTWNQSWLRIAKKKRSKGDICDHGEHYEAKRGGAITALFEFYSKSLCPWMLNPKNTRSISKVWGIVNPTVIVVSFGLWDLMENTYHPVPDEQLFNDFRARLGKTLAAVAAEAAKAHTTPKLFFRGNHFTPWTWHNTFGASARINRVAYEVARSNGFTFLDFDHLLSDGTFLSFNQSMMLGQSSVAYAFNKMRASFNKGGRHLGKYTRKGGYPWMDTRILKDGLHQQPETTGILQWRLIADVVCLRDNHYPFLGKNAKLGPAGLETVVYVKEKDSIEVVPTDVAARATIATGP
jgi:hypothetical protein